MGGDDDDAPGGGVFFESVDDGGCGLGVEVAGGFVGEDDEWVADEGAA